uniref:Anti-lipopolysaccharide factor isoform 4 n=1 Tax=Penaeus monodon TaxID=6687 RepID=A5A3I9_PENMO|nr:anti-lipopolysaccharide factor isoform 4 [Penaeus monodon]
MRVSVLVSLVLVVSLVALFAPQCQAQGWEAVAAAVASKIVGCGTYSIPFLKL